MKEIRALGNYQAVFRSRKYPSFEKFTSVRLSRLDDKWSNAYGAYLCFKFFIDGKEVSKLEFIRN